MILKSNLSYSESDHSFWNRVQQIIPKKSYYHLYMCVRNCHLCALFHVCRFTANRAKIWKLIPMWYVRHMRLFIFKKLQLWLVHRKSLHFVRSVGSSHKLIYNVLYKFNLWRVFTETSFFLYVSYHQTKIKGF